MILYGWLLNADAQSQAGLEQYYYMNSKTISFAPLAWYKTGSNWYAEGRYNYESEKSLSLYAGRTFEKQSAFSYTISPMAGAVVGNYTGGSFALNADIDYKKIFLSLQSQYTFSIRSKSENFIFNNCDIGYQFLPGLSAGLSLQQTNLCGAKSDKGVFIKIKLGAWELPFYIFNTGKAESYSVFGLNFMWQHKKKTPAHNPQNTKQQSDLYQFGNSELLTTTK